MNRQPVVAAVCVLTVVASVVLGGGAAAAAPGSASTAPQADAVPPALGNNSSLGTALSTFMQTSAVETKNEVEGGMWIAAFRQAPDESARQRLVEQRVNTLQGELAALRDESESADGEVRAIVVGARIQALERSVEETGEVINRSDVNSSEVDGLRRNVSDLKEPRTPSVPGGDVAPESTATTPLSDAPTASEADPFGNASPVATDEVTTGPPENGSSTERQTGAGTDAAAPERRGSPEAGPSFPGDEPGNATPAGNASERPAPGAPEAETDRGNGSPETDRGNGSSDGTDRGSPGANGSTSQPNGGADAGRSDEGGGDRPSAAPEINGSGNAVGTVGADRAADQRGSESAPGSERGVRSENRSENADGNGDAGTGSDDATADGPGNGNSENGQGSGRS